MSGLPAVIVAGFALGLTGALHCAAMCGSVTCSALLVSGAATVRARLLTVIKVQGGRIATYVLLGTAAAAIGTVANPLEAGQGLRVAQGLGATVLFWCALTAVGLVPRLAPLDRGVLAVSTLVDQRLAPLRRVAALRDAAFGVVLGFNACPLVYGAIAVAALTGQPVAAAAFMLGFGLATSLPVGAAALGLSLSVGVERGRVFRAVAAVMLAVAAVAPLIVDQPMPAWLCASR